MTPRIHTRAWKRRVALTFALRRAIQTAETWSTVGAMRAYAIVEAVLRARRNHAARN
jgi:hypothetical protein